MNIEIVSKTWEKYWKEKDISKRLSPYSQYFFDTHLLFFEKWIDFKNKRILEIGVGEGRLLLEIAKKEAVPYGIDISISAVKLTKARFQHYGIKGHIIQGNAFKLPFKDNSFDFTFALGLIEHFADNEEKAQIMKELNRVTKDIGIVVISVPKKWSVYTPKKIINKLTKTWKFGYEEEFTIDPFMKLVSSYLKNIEIKGIDIHPSLFRLIPARGPIKWLDIKLIIPIIQKIEKKYPNFCLKIAHMLCAKGTPIKK